MFDLRDVSGEVERKSIWSVYTDQYSSNRLSIFNLSFLPDVQSECEWNRSPREDLPGRHGRIRRAIDRLGIDCQEPG